MINKNIELTSQQDSWIKHQIEIGYFDNESEVVRELIHARLVKEREST